jgi:hypothetical protein
MTPKQYKKRWRHLMARDYMFEYSDWKEVRLWRPLCYHGKWLWLTKIWKREVTIFISYGGGGDSKIWHAPFKHHFEYTTLEDKLAEIDPVKTEQKLLI